MFGAVTVIQTWPGADPRDSYRKVVFRADWHCTEGFRLRLWPRSEIHRYHSSIGLDGAGCT